MIGISSVARRLLSLSWKALYEAVLLISAYLVVLIVRSSSEYENLWLFAERPLEARDNGYALFSYVRQSQPGVNAVFVISSASPDFHNIHLLGKHVEPDSFRHYMAWFAATFLISTDFDFIAPGRLAKLLARRGYQSPKRVFLGHGVTGHCISASHLEATKNFRLVLVSSAQEQDFFIRRMGLTPRQTSITGYCRFDRLSLSSPPKKRQVLVMPTWRRYLSTSSSKSKSLEEIDVFLESEYLRTYKHFLYSEHLQAMLRCYDFKLVFYLHHRMQPFRTHFGLGTSEVIIASENDHDPQSLLLESEFLITDYSSVQFDFAYMKRPIIYFQFDTRQFFERHCLEKGFFEFSDDGFGPIANEVDVLLSILEEQFASGIEMQPYYKERVEKFFNYGDAGNCKRTFEAIAGLLPTKALYQS